MAKFFVRGFGVAIGVIVVHAIAILLGVYDVFPLFDVPMHFMGGVAMGVLGCVILQTLGVKMLVTNKKESWLPGAVSFFWVLGFVAIMGIVWEWHEFLFPLLRRADSFSDFLNTLAGNAGPILRTSMQPSLGDTMADLFFDLLGGAVAYAVMGKGTDGKG